jgi:sec-independent protein translocase protein TatA
MRLGGWEIVIVLGVILILFGPRRLPEIGKAFGRTIQEFRQASKHDDNGEQAQAEDKTQGKTKKDSA